MTDHVTRRFWQFRAAGDGGPGSDAELLLYGDIAAEQSWWYDTISPKKFNQDLAKLGDVRNLLVRINSYGGDVFAAHAIYNSLVHHPANVTVRVDGIAVSAATIVMLAGDRVVMPENAMIMVHNPWTVTWGDSRDLRKEADTLDQVRESMLATYQARTGLSRDELVTMMDEQTWMTADEAVEMGFADEVVRNEKTPVSLANGRLNINGMSLDLSRMRMIPVALVPGATVDESSTPDEGVEEITASAGAEQTNDEEETVMDKKNPDAPEVDEAAEEPVATDAAPIQTAEEIAARERARIVAIQKLAVPGVEEIISAAIDNGESPEATAYKIMTSESVKSAYALAARKSDAQALAGVEPEPVSEEEAKRQSTIDRIVAHGVRAMKFVRGGGVK